ncbi:MAG TPA: patatin family protein, partial [Ignavibacteriales bacterium]|nr:patatin family protein [Ignavibacteriales bacterium]
MDLSNTGLVLEGGGMRGVYTSGALQFLMEKNIYLPYVIGVSMGACNATNYVSRQPGRNRIVNIKYVNDKRYLSYSKLITRGELFQMGFIYNELPKILEPFDYKTFYENKIKCVLVATDCITGEALYYEKNDLGEDYMKVLQASSSLPFIARPVKFRGRILMDGGMSDSSPIRRCMQDGNAKNIVILTQPEGYRKQPESAARLARLRYPHYKGLCAALANRHTNYNEMAEYVEQLKKEGSVFVLRPKEDLNTSR